MQVKEFKLGNQIYNFREKLNNLLETSMVQTELKGIKFRVDID